MSPNRREPRAEGNKRGPKRDTRTKVAFRVEDFVLERLVAMRAQTSLGPDENAALLLHHLVTSPETIGSFLAALIPAKPPAASPVLEPPTNLASRRQVSKN